METHTNVPTYEEIKVNEMYKAQEVIAASEIQIQPCREL